MSDKPKHDSWVLRLALGMIFCAVTFYIYLAPHDWRGRGRNLDHCITDWQFFYPFIGGLLGLVIEAASHLRGGNFGKITRYIAWGAVLVITVAWHASESDTPLPGSKDAVGLPRPKPFLCFDRLAREDFARRQTALLTRPTVAILGGLAGCSLIAQLLIRRDRRTAEPPSKLPHWLR
jgi:hypothetical protein